MKKIILYVAIGIVPVLFSQCTLKDDLTNIQDSLDGVQLYIGSPEFKTSYQIEFVDAKTNKPITGKDVKVTVGGLNAANVYDNIGSKQEQYTAFDGLLGLAIDPRLDNSVATNPLYYTINAKVDGYAPVTKTILVNEAKRTSVTIPLINLTTPPEGVTVITNPNVGATDSKGAFKESKTIPMSTKRSAVKSSSMVVSNSIEIPAGLVLLGENGQPLEGTVSANAWFGGFRNDFSGTYIDANGLYTRHGYYQLQLIVTKGNKSDVVASVSGGDIKYTLGLPSVYTNPKTSAALKVGDVFKRESTIAGPNFTSTTTWTDDVVQNTGNGLFFQFSTKGLAVQWMDFVAEVGKKGPVFKFVSDTTVKDEIFFNYTTTWNNQVVYSSQERIYKPWSTLQTYNIPMGQTTHTFKPITFESGADVEWRFTPESVVITNANDNKEYLIQATKFVKPGVDFIDIVLDFTAVSELNKQLVVKPNTWLRYAKVGTSSNTKQSEMKSGKITFHNIVVGTSSEYTLAVTFGGNYYTGNMFCKKEGNNYVIKFGFDDFQTESFTRTAVQNGNSKEVRINYVLTLSESVFNEIQK